MPGPQLRHSLALAALVALAGCGGIASSSTEPAATTAAGPAVAGFAAHDGALDVLTRPSSYGQCPGPCGSNADGSLTRSDLSTGQSTTLVGNISAVASPQIVGTPKLIAAGMDTLVVFDAAGAVTQTDDTFDIRYGLQTDGEHAYYVSTTRSVQGIARTDGHASTLVVAGDQMTWWDAFTVANGRAYVAQSCIVGNAVGEHCEKSGIYAASVDGNDKLTLLLPLPASELPEEHYGVFAVLANAKTLAWIISNDITKEIDLYSAALAAPQAAPVRLLHVAGEYASQAVLDDTHAYVCSVDSVYPARNGRLRRVSLADGTSEELTAESCIYPQRAGKDLYWLTLDGVVKRMRVQ